MQQKLLIILFLAAFSANAQAPIFNSGMTVVTEGSVSSPYGEEVWSIIDGDVYTKFLDFDYSDGAGFTVDLGGTTAIASSIDITTANDSEGRDPMNYEVLGSNDGVAFTSIATGSIPCVYDRFLTRSFSFSNTIAYSYYRIIFTDQCSSENSLQIAEVQLFETVMGINDLVSVNNDVVVYPNPSKGSFSVKHTASGSSIDKVVIVDATGKVVKEVVLKNDTNQKEINTENIASGIYFAKIYSGETFVIKKLILN